MLPLCHSRFTSAVDNPYRYVGDPTSGVNQALLKDHVLAGTLLRSKNQLHHFRLTFRSDCGWPISPGIPTKNALMIKAHEVMK